MKMKKVVLSNRHHVRPNRLCLSDKALTLLGLLVRPKEDDLETLGIPKDYFPYPDPDVIDAIPRDNRRLVEIVESLGVQEAGIGLELVEVEADRPYEIITLSEEDDFIDPVGKGGGEYAVYLDSPEYGKYKKLREQREEQHNFADSGLAEDEY